MNLHGTSTEMNDRVETRALKLALGEHARRIPMSGLKSQIGHAQGACGSASLAATLIAMEHGKIPPTINLDVSDPECDLDYVPDLGRKAQIEHAICNCVGFGSKNSALVLRKSRSRATQTRCHAYQPRFWLGLIRPHKHGHSETSDRTSPHCHPRSPTLFHSEEQATRNLFLPANTNPRPPLKAFSILAGCFPIYLRYL